MCHTPPSAGTSSEKSVSLEIVRKAIIFTAGVLIACGSIEAFFAPKFGMAALDAAHNEYMECVRNLPVIDCAGMCKFRVPSEADCLGAYLDRQETIRWRYFFFQILAKHL